MSEPQRVSSATEALALLRDARVMTLTPSGTGVLSLVGAVTGGPIKGSWWAHPAGKTIYGIAEAFEASPEVLCCTVVAGRVSYVHRGVWPALFRIVHDGEWRTWAQAPLEMNAIDLLDRIERARELRLPSPTAEEKKAKDALKRAGLVLAGQEHTESGRHETVLRSWRTWEPPPIVRAEAGRLSYDQARVRLIEIGTTLFGTRLPRSDEEGSPKRAPTKKKTP